MTNEKEWRKAHAEFLASPPTVVFYYPPDTRTRSERIRDYALEQQGELARLQGAKLQHEALERLLSGEG
jgi:hypothetical protein